MSDKKIAFIGTGNMSYAIIGGMVKNGFNANNIIATNRNQEKLAKVAADFKVQTTSDNNEAMRDADVIVLSVKPQMMGDLCQSFQDSGVDFSDKLFISVAAGLTVKRLREMLGQDVKMVRCMPNTHYLAVVYLAYMVQAKPKASMSLYSKYLNVQELLYGLKKSRKLTMSLL